jgi:beta-glucosidase
MEDTYLAAFRAAIVEGKAESTMCAYNRINGEPACANTFLLESQLRGAWGFKGYVVSDCDAVADIYNGHHFTRSLAEAGAVSLKTGMDNECADFFTRAKDNSDYVKFIDAVHQGILSEKDIDVSLRRLFTARMRLGMFDPPEKVPYANIPESEIDSAPHRQLALQAARESIVLLKNDGALPLNSSIKKIAVVGPLAEQLRVLEGNYNGTPSHSTSALEGIRKQFASADVTFAPGMNFLRTETVVPGSVLTTPDGKPGLKAEYFADELKGTPQVSRVDSSVNLQLFRPGNDAVAPPEGMRDFSVRWTGFLTPMESGKYNIGLSGSMNRLWFDGKLILDDSELHDPHPRTVPVDLQKGHRYPVKVEYLRGGFGTRFVWLSVLANPLADAVAAAKNADAVVAVVGITSQLEGEEMKVNMPGFVGGDRTSIDLPKEEQDLLEAVGATGKPLIVVLMNGSALSVNWANAHANAILDAWYSGEEGGTAIGETISGTNNPAGRLPVTFYTGVDQLPPFTDYAMTNRTYRYFEGKPLYPFGFGLSYSKFEYSNLKLSTNNVQAGDPLTVDADVKNTSQKDGDEVAELYITFPKLPGTPLHALRGFTRVHVAAGSTQHVEFKLDPRGLSMVDLAGDRWVAAGNYTLTVGGGQPGTAANADAQFTVTGNQKLPE